MMISYPTLRRFLCTAALGIAVDLTAAPADVATISVNVRPGGAFTFSPATVNIQVGDTVTLTDAATNALADPVLQIFDANGLLISNDDWKDTQQTEIQQSGLATKKDKKSALLVNLPRGAYTAIVTGKDGTTGVALVEIYRL